jgi:hypothetical protein
VPERSRLFAIGELACRTAWLARRSGIKGTGQIRVIVYAKRGPNGSSALLKEPPRRFRIAA